MRGKLAKVQVPKEVRDTIETLERAGYEAYVVGGCVRDLLLGKNPKDWDIATNARPSDIQKLFSKTFYENTFGTVGVVYERDEENPFVIEVTPYRTEGEYSDKRRPDSVIFSDKIDDDLGRRDFTINAFALSIKEGLGDRLIDRFNGEKDLEKGVIRSVGDPHKRLSEDALRIMRAVRLSAELGFDIEEKTLGALRTHSSLLEHIARERIRDEFVRIIMSDHPMRALVMAEKIGIIKYIAPELVDGIGVEQTTTHAYDVWEHLLRTLEHSAKKKYPLEVRLAALFHDIGKPKTRRRGTRGQYTFYGHEVVGARITEKIMRHLNFPNEMTKTVVSLVRWHMFFSDTETITLSAVRRMIANVGRDRIWDLVHLRVCDRIGTGRPKEHPYRLRKYKSMIEEALRDPVSVGMLEIDGADIMKILDIKPGQVIGLILNALMEEVLDDPNKNSRSYLERRVGELAKMDEKDLKKLAAIGKDKKNRAEDREIETIRKRHGVK